jgi:hypothetical protein
VLSGGRESAASARRRTTRREQSDADVGDARVQAEASAAAGTPGLGA